LIDDLAADDHYDDQSKVVASTRTLADRTQDDVGFTLEVGTQGAIPPLVRLLVYKEPTDEWSYNLNSRAVQMNAAATLAHLALFRQHALTIVQSGALPMLVQLSFNNDKNVPTKVKNTSLEALAALASYCTECLRLQ